MKDLEGDLRQPVTIEKNENVNYEYFALLVTIISLVAFDFTTLRGLILLVVLFLILGAIFIKQNFSILILPLLYWAFISIKQTPTMNY
jgi:hypothetical protein